MSDFDFDYGWEVGTCLPKGRKYSFGLCMCASGHCWFIVIADIWVAAGTCASSCLITQLQYTCEVNSSEQRLFSCSAFIEYAPWKKCYWNFCYKILPVKVPHSRRVYRIVSTFWITSSVSDKTEILKLVFMIRDIIFVKQECKQQNNTHQRSKRGG